jgi:FkbH-like protein
MTLNQALALIKERRGGAQKSVHFLVCGFQPLHLATFLHAYLLERRPGNSVEILTGLYGDLEGNLTKALGSAANEAAVVLEWSDIDPRLGLRANGGWSNSSKEDIMDSCRNRFARFTAAIQELAARMPVVVATPNLSLPPIGNTIRAQASEIELELEYQLAHFRLDLSKIPRLRILDSSHLAQLSPADARLDPKMELLAGFPYTRPYASELARSLVEVLDQRTPKKGLITDLDDTLWSGIIGEVGPEAVSWQQENHSQTYGLYQQMLGHLAGCGVLLAACSKNELPIAQAGLARKDLLLNAESLFPVCAGWGPKSKSVAEILRVWNIGADAVIFIDDNPMELDEVQQAFPAITCLPFPGKDPDKLWHLLGELRDLFGKPLVLEEDRLRSASLRASAEMREMAEETSSPQFLRSLHGGVTLDYRKNASDGRLVELLNKTNQFNLNGLRTTEGEWRRFLENPGSISLAASYQDKFGPLGKIAVLAADRAGPSIRVSHWVMSCRAFSRGIEFHMLESLFRQSNAEEIEFAFQATDRNQPLQEFFRLIGVQPNGSGNLRLARSQFSAHDNLLPHQVSELLQ